MIMRLPRLPIRFVAAALTAVVGITCAGQTASRLPGELAWTIGYDPKTFDPAKVDDQESELVRYLTAGVLLRFNRSTQKVEPQLAEDWSISSSGRTVTFKLRADLEFSDGTRLTAKDAAWSIRRVLLPATGAPVAEEFLSAAGVTVETPDERTVLVHLPRRVIGIGKVFDEIAIEPADRPSEGRLTAGPFVVADYRRSQYVRLRRNPHYSGPDSKEFGLPYATGIRLDILDNHEQEIRLFEHGEYDVIDSLPPDYFSMLKQKAPNTVRDLGPHSIRSRCGLTRRPVRLCLLGRKHGFKTRRSVLRFRAQFIAQTWRGLRMKAMPPLRTALSRLQTLPGSTVRFQCRKKM